MSVVGARAGAPPHVYSGGGPGPSQTDPGDLVVAQGAVAPYGPSGDTRYCLAAVPALTTNNGGEPRFTLTIVLSSPLEPGAGDLAPHIAHGHLAFEVSLAPSAELLARCSSEEVEYAALFVQRATVRLEDETSGEVARTETAGQASRVAMNATLSRDGCLGVLAALRGEGAGIALHADAAYRKAPPPGPVQITGLGALHLEAPLEAILGGALDGLDETNFIHLIEPMRGSETALRSAPRLVTATRTRDRTSAASLPLARQGSRLTSIALAMTPERARLPTAHALIASDVSVRRADLNAGIALWAAQDVMLPVEPDSPEEVLEHLPVIPESGPKPLLQDRIDPNRYWYAPTFEVVSPEPTEDPAGSPFSFTFEQAGLIGGGAVIEQGLQGSARFLLRPSVPPEVQAESDALGGVNFEAVPISNLSVNLEVPFRDKGSGETKTELFVAEVENRGTDIAVTVSLIDDWVRLCYGSLAYPTLQSQPARLRVAYAFRSYRQYTSYPGPVILDDQLVTLEVVPTIEDVPQTLEHPVFVIEDVELHLADSIVALRRERPGVRTRARRSRARRSRARRNDLLIDMGRVDLGAIEYTLPTRIPDPNAGQPAFALQSQVGENVKDVSFPCDSWGAFYLQAASDGDTSVGCQDVLRLGEIKYKQYDEILELRNSRCRVFRSLQQPGRFMVVPAAFRITRYGPSEGPDKAFRPAIAIYSIVEGAEGDRRYFITATLEPDIPLYMRYQLERDLVEFSPAGTPPQIHFPTDPAIQGETTYRWALPAGIGQPQVREVWDMLQVDVSADLTEGLALTTLIESAGLAGDVTFKLPDGLSINSQLLLDTQIIGPWVSGPVEVELEAAEVKLTNRADQTVNVHELVVQPAKPEDEPKKVPVDMSLEPGETKSVEVEKPTKGSHVVYSIVPQKLRLDELEIFVEDVKTNVVFVNLINFANHALTEMSLEARVLGSEKVHETPIAQDETVNMAFTLPLTSYLKEQVLEFRVTTVTAEATRETEWISWGLKDGAVISIDWELVA